MMVFKVESKAELVYLFDSVEQVVKPAPTLLTILVGCGVYRGFFLANESDLEVVA